MAINPIAGAALAAIAPQTAAASNPATAAAAAPATTGRAAPQDVISLSHAAMQSMQAVDTDGPGR